MTLQPEVNNVHVAVLALAQLGGAMKNVYSEEIAARAFELAPDRFSWILPQFRSRDWPDKESVRAALVNAQTKEYGRLVRGAYNKDLSKDGWGLTAAGSEWIIANEQRIQTQLAGIKRIEIPKREAQRFCKSLKSDSLFKIFIADGCLDSASQYQFTDMLECSPDAPNETIRTKFDRLLAMAHIVKDDQILAFLRKCKEHFADLLRESQDREIS